MKTKAEKKVQIAIDKMVDLMDDFIYNNEDVIRILDKLRELETKISFSSQKINGKLKI